MGVNITNFVLIAKTSVLTFQVTNFDPKYEFSRVVSVQCNLINPGKVQFFAQSICLPGWYSYTSRVWSNLKTMHQIYNLIPIRWLVMQKPALFFLQVSYSFPTWMLHKIRLLAFDAWCFYLSLSHYLDINLKKYCIDSDTGKHFGLVYCCCWHDSLWAPSRRPGMPTFVHLFTSKFENVWQFRHWLYNLYDMISSVRLAYALERQSLTALIWCLWYVELLWKHIAHCRRTMPQDIIHIYIYNRQLVSNKNSHFNHIS